MTWKISKSFDFCYGHRVWSQELNPDYSLDPCLKCRHLHGHQGKVVVFLEATKLKNGMVTDFKHLNWFKQFLDDVLDHKFIIDINDPLFETLLPHYSKEELMEFEEGYKLVDLTKIKDEPLHIKEMYEGYVLVDFVPTSENLSAWFLKITSEKMQDLGIKVASVEFAETPKSKSHVYA
ncbi:6-carboxytetrahydropterin synthase [Halarcobacter anaerophilus]|uniref:6-carboxy-5,6,7,8-tetrahydropterin synthase n=1 Tax=Halarcobacter anaerophilus TaxID=877500 RepID=A0A4Q0XXK1_9BACT|nr:6-carboxytetrahydropterin synthase [Halarcobacter anaerophilus]QDF27949.1 6-carboxy-5,6,7,8-tetrahydropterin synthase [Halarcobacter anaerophilus]RXJ61785.1 6-carboxytetrahydropterin synthase [Halarcobacter anaerophilus]